MLLKNDRGSALVMVLLVLTVGALIGVAMLTVGVNEDMQVSAEEKTIQAYYVAKTGADVAAAYIIEEKFKDAESDSYSFDMNDFINSVNNDNGYVEFEEGTALLNIQVVGSTVEIEATSTYDTDYSGHAIVVLGLANLFDHLVWSETEIDSENLQVFDDGDGAEIASNADIDVTYKTTGGAVTPDELPNQTYQKPDPILPTGLPVKAISDYPSSDASYDYEITESVELNGFTLNNEDLIIDTTSGDIDIILTTSSFKGDLEIRGSNDVNLYLREHETLTFQTNNVTANGSSQTDPEQLTINLMPDSILHFLANGDIYAYIYGPSALVDLGSSQTHLYGAIICEELDTNSFPDLTYVAPSDAYNNGAGLMERILWKD